MKKKNCIIAIIMVAILTLSITASAYFADVYAEHWFTDLWIYGSSTIEPNTDSGLSELYAQVSIQDGDLNEYGFNNRTVKNPTISRMKVTASARKSSIPPEVAELIIVAYGHIKYMTKYGEQKDYWTDDDAFFTSEYYTSGVAEKDNSYNREIGVLYNETRANYIFESFGMNPTQYVYACDFDLLEYTEVDEYLSIREYMNIQNGTTTPSFFIKDNTIFGVCQDVTAMNYIYEFMKDSDGKWILRNTQRLQDVGRYQDLFQSFSDYQATVNKTVVSKEERNDYNEAVPSSEEVRNDYNKTRADYIFESFGMDSRQYVCASDYELLNYVETDDYSLIRTSMNIFKGTSIPAFFMKDNTIFGVCQDAEAINYMYEFVKDSDGKWALRNTQKLQDVGRYQDVFQSSSDYQTKSNKS